MRSTNKVKFEGDLLLGSELTKVSILSTQLIYFLGDSFGELRLGPSFMQCTHYSTYGCILDYIQFTRKSCKFFLLDEKLGSETYQWQGQRKSNTDEHKGHEPRFSILECLIRTQ